MNTTLKDILAVLAGVFLSALTMMAIQMAGRFFFPLPEGFDPENTENMVTHLADISVGAMIFSLLAWFVGALTGVLLSIKLAPVDKKMAGGLVGFIFWLIALQDINLHPYPLWVTVSGLLAAPLATFIIFMAVGRQPDEEDESEPPQSA